MWRWAILGLALASPAWAQAPAIRDGGALATSCKAFADHPEGYNRTPEGASDPCRKFLDGYFRTLKDKSDAELKAKAEQVQTPAPSGPCVRMPDVLTYRDFAQRIVAFDAANPAFRAGSPVILAQMTLEASFPCPNQGPARQQP